MLDTGFLAQSDGRPDRVMCTQSWEALRGDSLGWLLVRFDGSAGGCKTRPYEHWPWRGSFLSENFCRGGFHTLPTPPDRTMSADDRE